LILKENELIKINLSLGQANEYENFTARIETISSRLEKKIMEVISVNPKKKFLLLLTEKQELNKVTYYEKT
jgi:hypothetical protein